MGKKIMNNILLAEDINKLEEGNYTFLYHKNVILNVQDKTFLSNFSKDNYDLTINIENNASVNFDKVDIIRKNINIAVNINSDSAVKFNWLIINEGNNKVQLTINVLGNNNKVEIRVRAINRRGNSNLDIICDGIINKDIKDNIFVEDLKGLLLNDSVIKISPNMLVNSNEVVANHLVTIGYLDPNMLFYLKSRGLSEKLACKLLLESFTCSLMNEELKSLIRMEVKDFE